jgi:ADP-ribose pyrophosphatase
MAQIWIGADRSGLLPERRDDMDKWKRLESRRLVSDRWLELTADRCLLQNGTVLDPYYVLHDRDWVQVFATNVAGELLVVEQYRYAANTHCMELPGGVVEEHEEAEAAAKRELLEETGFSSTSWDYVGSMFANPARQTNRIHVFTATNAVRSAEPSLDPSEVISVSFMDPARIEEKIRDGVFAQALHIAGFYRGWNHLKLGKAGQPGGAVGGSTLTHLEYQTVDLPWSAR